MALTHTADTWQTYRMDYRDPYRSLEPLEEEIAAVHEALAVLAGAGLLPHTTYDHAKMLAHRQAVRAAFDVPWTAITPRMERLIYAINALRQPQNMIAAGVFCGFTFISNAGAAVGPGACYTAENLLGVEIRPEEAARAEGNVRRLDPTGVARVIAADALDVLADFDRKIDLLYLDADGDRGRGKGIYLDLLEAALPHLSPGALLLAHNSMNGGQPIQRYLDYVRDPANLPASVNLVLDIEGLEVSQAP